MEKNHLSLPKRRRQQGPFWLITLIPLTTAVSLVVVNTGFNWATNDLPVDPIFVPGRLFLSSKLRNFNMTKMLVYLASGERNFDKEHLKPFSRVFWEFEAVVEGRIRLCHENGVGPPRSRTLWVFPPGHAHAWRGDRGRSAQVIVFHFEDIPSPVSEWVRAKQFLELPLDPIGLEELKKLHQKAVEEWERPTVVSSMIWQRLAIDLAMLVARIEHPSEECNQAHPGVRVQQAMRLFVKHIKDAWNVDHVAQSMAISPAHLRRLFHQVLHSSPREIFEELRLNRAKELMMVPNSKLEDVAHHCGYENGAVLSRAFKRHYGIPPSQWRGQRD